MNDQNLIPNSQRTTRELQEMGRKGGRAGKGVPRYQLTKCKNCKLPCPIKAEGTEQGWKCKVPDTKRKILEAAIYPEKLTESLFADAFQLQLDAKNFSEKKEVFNAKLALKKEINPNTDNLNMFQQNIQINVLTDEKKEEIIRSLLNES